MATREVEHRQNYLGAGGWAWGGNYKLERYLYLLHRITGLGIILFGFFHLIETTFFRTQGQTIWEATMTLLEKPWFEAGLYLVSVAFTLHALNGLRLILQEFGLALGRPSRPIYPYQDALRKKRPWTVILVIVIVALSLLFLFDTILTGGG
jgi:succinate dehydrogenase / fumarate reductase cytochrome b subunit